MTHSPPSLHRRQKTHKQMLQPGTIVSCTTIAHPPSRFGHDSRIVALIELEDGSRVMAPILTGTPVIGADVLPRMHLNQVSERGLRSYEVGFDVIVKKLDPKPQFRGYILALTGPSGVGKTTISRQLVSLFTERTVNVPILTTRGRKKGDEGEYRYITEKEFKALKRKGEIVAHVEIPSKTESRHYGYLASDIEAIRAQGKLPVVITEMHLLQGLSEHYGRRSILSFGVLPPGRSKRAMLSALLHRLRDRGRDSEESIRDRLENAEADLRFFEERSDLFDHLITNDDLDSVMTLFKQKVPALQEA